MDRKIKFIDFLFEGYTSDLVEEKNKLKKKVKKHKKKADGTTSSGHQVGSAQDVVSKEWYP